MKATGGFLNERCRYRITASKGATAHKMEGVKVMASVIWDVGQDIKSTYISLFELAGDADKFSKEELVKIIEDEAKSLKSTYRDLAEDHGWVQLDLRT